MVVGTLWMRWRCRSASILIFPKRLTIFIDSWMGNSSGLHSYCSDKTSVTSAYFLPHGGVGILSYTNGESLMGLIWSSSCVYLSFLCTIVSACMRITGCYLHTRGWRWVFIKITSPSHCQWKQNHLHFWLYKHTKKATPISLGGITERPFTCDQFKQEGWIEDWLSSFKLRFISLETSVVRTECINHTWQCSIQL